MFGFLKKFGKKSEPAPLIPVAVPPSPFAPVAVAEPEYTSAPATMPKPIARTAMPVRSTALPTRSAPLATRPLGQAAAAPEAMPELRMPVAATLRQAPVVETPRYEFPTETEEPIFQRSAPAAAMSDDELVQLSLKKLWHKLNPAIVQGATSHPDGDSFLQMPLSVLREQLAKGSVKFPFPQFRQYAPEGLFPASAEKDALEVALPIGDLLPLLKKEYLSRRPGQKRIQVPEEIGSVFGPGGAGLKIAEGKRNAEPKRTTPATPVSAPMAPVAPVATAPIAPIAPVAPSPASPTFTGKVPLPFTPAPGPEAKIAAPNIPPMAFMPAPALDALPTEEDIPTFVVPPPAPLRNDPIPAPKLDPGLATLKPKAATNGAANGVHGLHAAPAPVPATVPPAAAVPAKLPSVPATNGTASSNGSDTFMIALMDVAAFWAEKGRNDLSNLYKHSLEIPMNTLESGLKAGRLTFQWREVRPWLRLAPGNTMPTLQDDLSIDLPLAIIAPRFMEQRMLGRAKSRVEVADDIPNPFEQKTRPAGSTPAMDAPGAPVLGATAVPMELSTTQAASSKTGDTAFLTATAGKPLLEFGEIFGQPEKKHWTLAEVTTKTMSLRGVAGAVLGSMDGLLVAGSWPNGVKGDAVAAFLPQLYGRLLHFTKEVKMGEPTNVTLTIDNVPLQIFKAGTSFFTVIGRAGENLPKAQLNAIATRLSSNFSVK